MTMRRAPTGRPDPPSGGVKLGALGEARIGRSLALFVILALFWFLLSGRIGLQYAIFMVVAAGVVLTLNPERPFGAPSTPGSPGLRARIGAAAHLARYVVWLVWNVMKANVDVAIRILHPKLPIRPRLMHFRTSMEHEVAQVLVANSITLTPGTVTIDLQNGEYIVHALHPDTAELIVSGELQNAVASIFAEGPDRPSEVRWSSSFRDLAI